LRTTPETVSVTLSKLKAGAQAKKTDKPA